MKKIDTEPNYSYSRRELVKENEFNDSAGKLSKKMEAIRQTISETAIDDLDEKKFRSFYEKDFIMADFTDIIDKDKNQSAGFLFATFHENKTGIGPKYLAKAFHAVKKEYRQKGKPYDRTELYKKYMEFYLRNILLLELRSFVNDVDTSWVYTGKMPSINEIKKLISNSKSRLTSKVQLQIEIFAENPTTYSDIRKFQLTHETVKDQPGKYAWLKSLNPAELMLESCKLYVDYENAKVTRPYLLEKTDFTVNTSHLEWLNFFSTNDEYKLFYLWQNFYCPVWTFKMKIPVDPDNILNALFAIIELKGYDFFQKFLNKNPTIKHAYHTVFRKSIKKEDFKIPVQIKKLIKKFLA